MAEGLEFRMGLDTGDAVTGAGKLDRQIAELTKKLKGLEQPGKLDALTAKIQAIQNPMMGVANASGRAAAGNKKHAESAGILGAAVDHLSHHFENIVKLVAEWDAAEFLLELPKRIFELGEEMLRTAAKAERTESSFKLLFGAAGGTEAIEDIETIGKNTEFAHSKIKALTQDLGKVGFEGQGLKRARGAALDIAAFSSNPEEGLGSALASLERIKRTGRVDNRTLSGVGIGEKDFLSELAKRTGESGKTLKKHMEEGKIDAEQSLEALYTVITKKTGKKLGGAGADIAEGLDATLAHLGELPERYFEKLSHSTGYAKFGEQLKHLLDELDPESPTGKRIFGALDDAFTSVSGAIGDIDVADLITEFATGFTEIASDVRPVVHVLEEVWDVVHKIGLGLGVMGGALNDYVVKPIAALDDLVRNNKASKAIQGTDWVNKFTPIGFFRNMGAKAADGYQKGLEDAAPMTKAASADVGYSSADALQSSLEIHSPSKVFARLGRHTGEGFAEGIGDSGPGVDRAIDLAMMAPARGAGGRGGAVTIAPQITVNVNGGKDAQSTAQAVASAVADILPSALQSAVDNMAVQAGAS